MKKKILSILLAVCLLTACLPIEASAFGADSGTCGNGVKWSYEPGSQTLTIEGSGTMNDYKYSLITQSSTAPWGGVFKKDIRTVQVLPGVKNIGKSAFQGCTTLTSVNIIGNVTSIGDCAFYGCSNLTSIKIPASVTHIGSAALWGSRNLKIYGQRGSAAESYAQQNLLVFVAEGGSASVNPPAPSTPVEPLPTQFVDVPAGQYYVDAVKWALKWDITSGTDASHFSPNAPCTRAQAVTFLWRTYGAPEAESEELVFTDVKAGDYFEEAVRWAVENGITSGTGEHTFSPGATCTRAQIVTFIYRAEGYPYTYTENSFSDVNPGDYFEDAVNWAVENEVTAGTGANRFSPHAPCTRAQIVTFLYRF